MAKGPVHAVDHVYFMDAGRLWVDFPKPLTGSTFGVAPGSRFQFYQHGNRHGVSFAVTHKGFLMAYYPELQSSLAEYLDRRDMAIQRVASVVSTVTASPMKSVKRIECVQTPYLLALSPGEEVLAAAYGTTLDMYAVADFLYFNKVEPLQRLEEHDILEAAWCPTLLAGHHAELCVLSQHSRELKLVRTDGHIRTLTTSAPPRSICWSPDGSFLAVGTTCGAIEVFDQDQLNLERTIARPIIVDKGFQAHHINWGEDEVMLVGFNKDADADSKETALVVLYENDSTIALGEVVEFQYSKLRNHQLYTAYLKEWRMFFIGCALSNTVELVVCAPDTGRWEIWKTKKRFQAKLPLDNKNQETSLVGLQVVLNSSLQVKVGDTTYPPAPIVSCLSSDCVVVNFSVVDLSEHEPLEFLQTPTDYGRRKTRRRLFSS